MTYAVKASHEHPVLVDHYLQGTEVEVDAICDGKEVLIPGIMEHVNVQVYTAVTPSPYIRRAA